MLLSRILLLTLPAALASRPALAAALPQDSESPAATAQGEPLLDHARLSLALQRLASEHTDLVSVLSAGYSRSGRIIEVLRIARGEATAVRPAILLVANIEGPLVYTSGMALDIARSLVEGAAADERVAKALERTTIYIVPRANPDGAEARFARPRYESDATGQDVDNDRDGRRGEDPPSDVDGDGVVAWMKVPSSKGHWIEDPTDPRVLVQADPQRGEVGRYDLVPEGRDKDLDGKASEDGPHDARVNRNFPQEWREHAPESGLFATDEPEARALCEFVLSKKEIQLVLVLGEQDLLVEKHKSASEREKGERGIPPSGILEADDLLLGEIAKRWTEIAKSPTKGGTDGAGSFQSWCYAQRGLLTVALKPWAIPLEPKEKGAKPEQEAGEGEKKPKGREREASEDAKRLSWIEANPEAGVQRFLPWTPYQHPELGAIEIGGFAPYGLSEPPAAERPRLAHETFELLLQLEGLLARIGLRESTIKELVPGLIEVKATVYNDTFLPLLTAAGKRARAQRGARVELFLPKDASLLAGRRQELLEDLPGAGGFHEYRWLVQGGSIHTIGISVTTDHAGSARYQEAK